MLSGEQLKSRVKLEKSLHKASLALNNLAESSDRIRKKYGLLKELRDRLGQCNIRLTTLDDLNNDATLDEINRTLTSATSWLQSPAYRAPRQSKTEPRKSSSVMSIAETADGSGLCAFKFGTLRNANETRATQSIFENNQQCENEPQRMTPISKKFYFTDRNKADHFKNTVFHFGLHFVIDHDYERYCLIRRDESSASKSMTVLMFYVFPMRSYKLSRSRLSLNQISIGKVCKVKSLESASEFLEDFGSHVALDRNQLGGILCQSVEITAPQALPVALFERYADEITTQSFIDLKFQPDGLRETLRNAEEAMDLECRYCLETLGPVVAQPKLFERLLDASPNDLQAIDRDFSSLVGVWDVVEEQRPDLKEQADLLRRAWLDKAVASHGSVVEREISKVKAALAAPARMSVSSRNNHRENSLEMQQERKRETPAQSRKPSSKDARVEKNVISAQQLFNDQKILLSQRSRPRQSSVVTVEVHETPGESGGNTSMEAVSPAFDPKQPSPNQESNSKKQNLVTQQLFFNENQLKQKGSLAFGDGAPKFIQPTPDLRPTQNPNNVKSTSEVVVIRTEKIEPIYAKVVKIPKSRPNQELETNKPRSSREGPESESSPRSHQQQINDEIKQVRSKTSINLTNAQSAANSSSSQSSPPTKPSNETVEVPDSIATMRTEHDKVVEEFNRINDIKPSSSLKKTYANYFLVDVPLNMTDPKLRMLMAIRRGIKPSFSVSRENGDHSKSPESLHRLFLETLGELDAPSIREMLSLLLENRYLIPLFNPLTKESYLGVIKDITVNLHSRKSRFVNLGSNKNLTRVAVISCRTDTQAPELIHSLFNMRTFHQKHVIKPSDQMAIDFGIGQLKSTNQWVLICYVVGDYKRAIDFIRNFADYLIVEDVLESENSIYQWVGQSWIDAGKRKELPSSRSPFADIPHVTFWTLSQGELSWIAPKDNFHIYGPDPLIIEAPLGDRLTDFIVRILNMTMNNNIEEKSFRPLSNRKCLRELPVTSDLIPLNGLADSEILNSYLDSLNIRQSLPLQRTFRKGYDARRPYLADTDFHSRLDTELEHNLELSVNISLVDIFLKSLQITNDSKRILILRLIEDSLFVKTEQELELLSGQIKALYNSYTEALHSVKKPTETAFALKKYIEAKENYKHSALYVGHVWREISLAYCIKPYAFVHLPALGAQHLLDGFKLELLYNGSISFNWVHAVLFELGKRIDQSKQRFFIVSCIGQQQSQNSLVRNLFGLPKRTEGSEHYGNGICMQILPVIDRSEYDYLLILDAEDSWPPTRYEALQALQENYQIVTLCSLISDATVIVNPKTDEMVNPQILIEMFSGYEDTIASKVSRKSSAFSVYNWSECHVKVNPGKVMKRAVIFPSRDEVSLENNVQSTEYPHSFDKTEYEEITGMSELRETIHQTVTEPREGVQWTSRNLSTIEKQLTDAWTFACSVDFSFLHHDFVRK